MDPVQVALADEVREQVRRRRIDPRHEADAVRQVALDVVAEHERRSLTGAVRTLDEPDRVVGTIVAELVGLGPLQPLLDDPTVEEVWINEPDRVFVARDGRHELTSIILTSAQVRELVERMLSSSGRRLDVSQPFVDAMLPGGHRLHVVLEGISRGFSAVNTADGLVARDPVQSGRPGRSGTSAPWSSVVKRPAPTCSPDSLRRLRP